MVCKFIDVCMYLKTKTHVFVPLLFVDASYKYDTRLIVKLSYHNIVFRGFPLQAGPSDTSSKFRYVGVLHIKPFLLTVDIHKVPQLKLKAMQKRRGCVLSVEYRPKIEFNAIPRIEFNAIPIIELNVIFDISELSRIVTRKTK